MIESIAIPADIETKLLSVSTLNSDNKIIAEISVEGKITIYASEKELIEVTKLPIGNQMRPYGFLFLEILRLREREAELESIYFDRSYLKRDN